MSNKETTERGSLPHYSQLLALDVNGWVEEWQKRQVSNQGSLVDFPGSAGHYTAEVWPIVYHWLAQPQQTMMVAALHELSRQYMAAADWPMLSEVVYCLLSTSAPLLPDLFLQLVAGPDFAALDEDLRWDIVGLLQSQITKDQTIQNQMHTWYETEPFPLPVAQALQLFAGQLAVAPQELVYWLQRLQQIEA